MTLTGHKSRLALTSTTSYVQPIFKRSLVILRTHPSFPPLTPPPKLCELSGPAPVAQWIEHWPPELETIGKAPYRSMIYKGFFLACLASVGWNMGGFGCSRAQRWAHQRPYPLERFTGGGSPKSWSINCEFS